MGSITKTLVVLFIVLSIMSLVSFQLLDAKAQSNSQNSAPSIQWQQVYGSQVNYASNLIQTVDGGFVFMDLGYGVTGWFKPSIVIKVDDDGTLEWNKTIADFFTGSEIIQTNDLGFEISGWWNAYRFGGDYHAIPTVINTDSNGIILQIRNYTTLPSLGINSSKQIYPFEHRISGSIQTSDRGFAYWINGNITKTDSGNKTQWVKTLTYPVSKAYPTDTYPLKLTSVIETSDGAIAALGVGYVVYLSNDYSGKIYLIKTETFLPIPSPTQLPTAISTPTPIAPDTNTNSITLPLDTFIVIIVIFALALVILSVLLLRRHRKASNLNK